MCEIAEEVGLAVSTVSYHLSVLEQDGPCVAEPDSHADCPALCRSRSRPGSEEVEVPLIGQVRAGIPLDAAELAEETFCLPRRLVGHGTLFMLKVKGDSMIGAAIADGDLVVVRRQPTAENGDSGRPAQRDRDCRGHREDPAAAGRPRVADAPQPGLPADPC